MARRDKYDIHKIRSQVKKKVGKHSDPTEFRPPKAEDGKPAIKYRFYILPPYEEGAELANGPADQGMGEFFVRNGSHWIESKRLGCPRVINEGDCPICQHGFDLMSETDVREERRNIAQKLLPGTYYMVNLYFPPIKPNPEELQGQVRWYNCPKTVFDMWEDCLFRDDDGGDPQEPLPYGVFYDEEEAYLFQLDVVKHGQQNSYTASKFFVTESMQTRPLAGKSGEPDLKKIGAILAKRHELHSKLPDVSMVDIERIASNLTGDGDGDGGGGGFDTDETKQSSKQSSKQSKEETRKPKKGGIKPNVSESSVSKSKDEKPEDDLASELDGLDESVKSVSDEMPVDDPPFDAGEKDKAKDDGDDDDVDALLSQLGDD